MQNTNTTSQNHAAVEREREYPLTTFNKSIIIALAFICQLAICNLPLQAQNVGVNATGSTPNISAGFDVDFNNKGLLIPRIALTSTGDVATIATPATSLLVYNTATAGTSPNNVLPGFYYWNGTKWIALSGGTGGNDWGLLGNAGTTAGTNFLGTIDNISLRFRTNNTQKMIIDSSGNVGIGTAIPTGPLEVMALTTVTEATGGTITHSGGYTIHTFTSSGTFTMDTSSTSVEYLVVGGGASGGYGSALWGHCGGGGGAGRFREGTLAVTAQAYSITVGNGGSNGSDGGNSVFSTITSEGGGSGADAGGDGIGTDGGSGGGGTLGTSGVGGSSVGSYGNSGGAKGLTPAGGGGGGASAAGAAGWGVGNGAGGTGRSSSISGSSVTYAGGGGGGYGQPNNNGGAGGGGRGGIITGDPGVPGTANTGGGGGGAYVPSSGTLSGATGGSGVVIIRYLTPANNILGSAFFVGSTGNVGIGTASPSQSLHVVGNICYTGTIGSCSDIRYKKDITPLKLSLSNVLKIQGVNYFWRAGEFPQNKFNMEKQIGFIAQDLEKIYPEMVITDDKGYKSVDYSRLTPVLVEAIKELNAKNESQQKIIDNLQSVFGSLLNENGNMKVEIWDLKTANIKQENRLKKLEEFLDTKPAPFSVVNH